MVEQPLPHPRKILFLHIPRTGGSSLKSIPDTSVKLEYGQVHGLIHTPEAIRQDIQKRVLEFPTTPQVITGHFFHGPHEYLEPGWRYMTLLRDPVERVLSSFYHFVRLGELSPQDLPRYVEGELQKNRFTWTMNNLQTRYLSAVGTSDHFFLVGINESFDSSMMLLFQMLGQKMPYYDKFNGSPWKKRYAKTHDPSVIELIRTHNALDMELYEFAKERFEARIATQDEQFFRDLRTFQRKNPRAVFIRRMRLRLKAALTRYLPT
jgi:hypothetical protein